MYCQAEKQGAQWISLLNPLRRVDNIVAKEQKKRLVICRVCEWEDIRGFIKNCMKHMISVDTIKGVLNVKFQH